jgi:predicted transcriptional regulator
MPKRGSSSEVLSLRVSAELDRRLRIEARKRRQSRSEAARQLLEASLAKKGPDLLREARRQSRLARASESDVETLEFMMSVADTQGWR